MGVYGPWLADAIRTSVSGSIKAMLMTDAFVANKNVHYRSELTDEATGTGYTTGGVAASNVTVTYDAAAAAVKFSCDPVDFGAVTIPLVGAVVFYIANGSAATDVVIAADVFTAVEVNGTELVYQPATDGIVVDTVA